MEKYTYINYGKMEGRTDGAYHIVEKNECYITIAIYRGYYNIKRGMFKLYPMKIRSFDENIRKKSISEWETVAG